MPCRRLQKLVKNGNSVQVTIERPVLHFLEWIAGGAVVTEVTEDKCFVVRLPTEADLAPPRMRPTPLFDLKAPKR